MNGFAVLHVCVCVCFCLWCLEESITCEEPARGKGERKKMKATEREKIGRVGAGDCATVWL